MRGVLVFLCLVFGSMAIASEDPPDSKRFRFDIPAQPLGDALRHFGKQSGREVFFPSGEPEWQLQTQALIGLYTEKAALAKLLAGMPVRAHFEPPKLWTFHLGKTAAPENTVMPPDAA